MKEEFVNNQKHNCLSMLEAIKDAKATMEWH